ncbi:MAG: hypothetical protein MI756_09075 [Chromatiales bacterium]|nr:hypothetical protein [Chromatiales bacterium]
MGNRLTADQEKQIKRLIIDMTPDLLKMDYALWIRKAVMELIKQQTGIDIPVRAVGGYLKH